MEDYIEMETKLQIGKNSDIRYVQGKDLDNLEDIKIDSNQPKLNRIMNYIKNTKNPYMFVVEGKKVRFEFTKNGPDINECFKNILENKNI